MKKLDISTVLRFVDAVGSRNARFRHRGRVTTCMLFDNCRSLRTLVDGTEFELVPMSIRILFSQKVRSINAALLSSISGAYIAFSCRVGAEALFGKHLSLSMPGFELIGRLKASRFDSVLSCLTGRHYYKFMLVGISASRDCSMCNSRTGGRRCLDSCEHKHGVQTVRHRSS